MMKAFRIFTLAALGLAVLASCNKENGGFDQTRNLSVKASIGEMTKVTYDGAKSAFAAGDDLSLFAWTGDATAIPENLVVDNVTNTLGSDGLWAPELQMKWADMVTPHFFMAVSPAREVESFTADEYVLDPAADKYQESDLLIATNLAGLKANDNPVELVFDHAMAKLNVNLSFRNQWTAGNPPVAPNTEAVVKGLCAEARTNATVDYLNKEVTATGDASQIPMNKVQNASWTVLMVPQSGFTTITIELEGNDEWLGGNGTYVFTHTADIPLQSGKVTTVNLIVGRDQITLDKDAITINDWTAGDTIDNGEAQLPEDVLLSTVLVDNKLFYFMEGDTWLQALTYPENTELILYYGLEPTSNLLYAIYGDWYLTYSYGQPVSPNDVINPTMTYYKTLVD